MQISYRRQSLNQYFVFGVFLIEQSFSDHKIRLSLSLT